ncbi:hypothetical protein VPNG_04490 [Cytospora leucostoma]|uniref:Uncharacterized protein n=1 Tax=Cytospora leucostoma TaxID=1230097 RepID=A0A423XC13_9PEZI|nr:hypothetical protein VPNG_04490 [Cytospora leucostoma]
MSHSRQTSLDPQYQDHANRTSKAKAPLSKLSSGRPQSLNLPLRVRQNSPTGEKTKKQLKRATTSAGRASSANPRRFDIREFDLMAPPPGKRRSNLTQTTSLVDTKPHGSFDADPSEALTSRIAASILQEGYGVRAASATVPLKVQDAVDRCLQEVSTTVEDEHPQWALPTYHSGYPRSAIATPDFDQASDYSGSNGRNGTTDQPDEDSDVPFLYDQVQDRLERQGSQHHVIQRKNSMKARVLDATQAYPCPFRRRNPVVFNVRDQEQCARRPFADIQELKYVMEIQPNFATTHTDMITGVPADEICDVESASTYSSEENGITEEMDRVLADRKKVRTWAQIWRLLFPQDTAVLDPDFQPAVEMVEMEQELDDSQAELKADLSDNLKRLLPEQPDAVCFFLAGQFQLVFEQHRAKINRRCRQNTESTSNRTSTIERNRGHISRFSIRNTEGITRGYNTQSTNQQSQPKLQRQRLSQAQPIVPRTSFTPATASSVYSTHSSLPSISNSQPATRSSTFSMTGMQVESPRLPFRDWVQGIKFSNGEDGSQRDSGLAMDQCEVCRMEPCQCGSYAGYADQLSAFMTPAAPQAPDSEAAFAMGNQGNDDGEVEWATQYGDSMMPAEMPLPASAVEAQ